MSTPTAATHDSAANAAPLLAVRNLSVDVSMLKTSKRVVSEVTLDVPARHKVGVVGETGAGKSMLILALLGLLPQRVKATADSLLFKGSIDLARASTETFRELRGASIAYIPPNPRSSLNPTTTVGAAIIDVVLAHSDVSKSEAAVRAEAMLAQVGINDAARRMSSYPYELSGGMAQRIAIAMALVNEPELLICDEPTSGLDVTIQAQVLQLLVDLESQYGTGTLMVTRDLGVAAHHCDSIAVMYRGRVVEQATVQSFFSQPQHPYSTLLMGGAEIKKRRSHYFVPARKLPPEQATSGCICVDRCSLVEPVCYTSMPPLTAITPTQSVRCHVVARDGGLSPAPPKELHGVAG